MLTVPRKDTNLVSVCFGHSKDMEIATGAIGGDPTLRIVVVSIGLVLVAVRIYAYLSISVFLANHDKLMTNILPANTIARRRKQNAINLTGHMIQFALDLFILLVSGIIGSSTLFYMRYFSMGSYGLSGLLCIACNSMYRQDIADMFCIIVHRLGKINAPRIGVSHTRRLRADKACIKTIRSVFLFISGT